MAVNYSTTSPNNILGTSASDRPMLGVYEVYSVRSGNLSFPYTIQSK